VFKNEVLFLKGSKILFKFKEVNSPNPYRSHRLVYSHSNGSLEHEFSVNSFRSIQEQSYDSYDDFTVRRYKNRI